MKTLLRLKTSIVVWFTITSAGIASGVPPTRSATQTSAQGPQYQMAIAAASSGATVFSDGSLAVVGQAAVGTISNSDYTMEVGIVPLLFRCSPPLNDICNAATLPVFDGLNVHDNRCATTDGPGDDGCYPDPPVDRLHDEVWYQYTATCNGELTVSMCPVDGGFADYDAYVVVYGDGTPTCTCPTDTTTELACGDDTCGSVSGPPTVNIPVTQGNCYTIAVGGWDDGSGVGNSRGTGVIFVDCMREPCTVAAPPELAQWDSNAGPGVTLVDLRMNRYLGLRAPAAAAGQQQAIQVTFKVLPPPFDIWQGAQLWVQDPVQICETAGSDSISPPCGGTAATYPRAFLGCSPFYRDWTTVAGGTVYVTHPAIIPKKTVAPAVNTEYEIRMIDISCETGPLENYSSPKQVLQAKYGDMAGPFDVAGQFYTAPEGDNVGTGTDVAALVEKFRNSPKGPIKARTDMEPCRLDSKINISDVTEVLNGFRNLVYRFAPGSGNCTSTDPCGYSGAQEEVAGQ